MTSLSLVRSDSETTLYDESRPLLSDHEALKPASTIPTPLPKAQLAALCSVRLVDPIAFTQVNILHPCLESSLKSQFRFFLTSTSL